MFISHIVCRLQHTLLVSMERSMRMVISGNGVYALQAKLDEMLSQIQPLIEQAVDEAATQVVDSLRSAAPRGGSDSTTPPDGDEPGPLAESFYFEQGVADAYPGASVLVSTSQPTKLQYVTQGTGIYGPAGQRIIPVTAKALSWPGANHPVRSVSGQKPNDFVTPALANAPQASEILSLVIDQLAAISEI
jgi:hypothetical protein